MSKIVGFTSKSNLSSKSEIVFGMDQSKLSGREIFIKRIDKIQQNPIQNNKNHNFNFENLIKFYYFLSF
jgi:hypothetical protein